MTRSHLATFPTDHLDARETARVSFLRRQLDRDIEAEIARGVDRAWLEATVADAVVELRNLATRAEVRSPSFRAACREDERRIAAAVRRARAAGYTEINL